MKAVPYLIPRLVIWLKTATDGCLLTKQQSRQGLIALWNRSRMARQRQEDGKTFFAFFFFF
jgi:hypothetical protein